MNARSRRLAACRRSCARRARRAARDRRVAPPALGGGARAGQATVVKSLAPEDPQFGDTVTATIDVFVDLRRVDLRSVTVDGLHALSRRLQQASRCTEGSVGIVHVEHLLRCLDASCVPAADRATVQFTPLLVGYRSGSRSKMLGPAGPSCSCMRACAERSEEAVPPRRRSAGIRQGYRLPPKRRRSSCSRSRLSSPQAAERCSSARPAGASAARRRRDAPLERILRELAAVSSNGDSGRRRRALEELARELEPLDGPLSAESRVLAWAPTDPKQETIAELTGRVAAAVTR